MKNLSLYRVTVEKGFTFDVWAHSEQEAEYKVIWKMIGENLGYSKVKQVRDVFSSC